MANFKIEALDLNATVLEEDLQKSLDEIAKPLNDQVEELIQEHDEKVAGLGDEMATLKLARDEAVTEMNTAKTEAKKDNETIKTLNETFGSELTVDELKSIIDDANTYKDSLLNDVIKFGSLAGIIGKDEVETKTAEFKSMSNKELAKYRDVFAKIYNKGQGDPESQFPESEGDESPEKKKFQKVNKKAFMQDV